ncbi:MAG: hypothetical protein ACKOZL_10115 [Actinomycetes bacterium]
MRQVYACRLDMVYESGARTRTDAFNARVIARRLFEQYAGSDDWTDDDLTDWAPAPDHRVRIRRLHDDKSDDAATVILWERPHPDPALRLRTEAIIGVEDERGWVVVREAIGSIDPTLTPPVDNPRTPPGIVTELIGAIAFEDAMARLSIGPKPTAADDALALDAFLTSLRHLPVLVISDAGDGRTAPVATTVAFRVAGLAHVHLLQGGASTDAFNREVGAVHAVPRGGARLYWPRFRSIDAARNRAWQVTDVVRHDGRPQPSFIGAVVDAVFTAGALRVPDPPLVARLEAAEVRRTIERRRAERAARVEDPLAVEPPVAEPPVAAPPVVAPAVPVAPEPVPEPVVAAAPPDAVEEELLEEALGELQRVREHLARVEADRDRVQRDFDTMRDRWIARAHAGEVTDAPPPAEPLVAVVQRARELPHLRILPEAIKSARRWQYDRTNEVWTAFTRLEFLASEWASGALTGSFTATARGLGLDWAGGVSDTAKQKFAADYLREVDGRQVVLGPHLRMSGGKQLLRIYCALDETPGAPGGSPVRRLVIGHVGGHLRDQGADD